VVVILRLAQCSLAERVRKIRYSDSIFAGKYREPPRKSSQKDNHGKIRV
jgi:hypothetical protein